MPLVLAGPRGPTLWNEVDRLLSPGLRKRGELCLTEWQGMPRLVCDFQKCLCSPRCSLKDCREWLSFSLEYSYVSDHVNTLNLQRNLSQTTQSSLKRTAWNSWTKGRMAGLAELCLHCISKASKRKALLSNKAQKLTVFSAVFSSFHWYAIKEFL